jgi:hypothetical protein
MFFRTLIHSTTPKHHKVCAQVLGGDIARSEIVLVDNRTIAAQEGLRRGFFFFRWKYH